MRSPRLRMAALAAAPILLLTACSVDGDGTGGDDAAATSAVPEGNLADLSVDTEGEAPVITWNGEPFDQGALPFRVTETGTETVTDGSGDTVDPGQELYVRYVAINGTTGEQVLSTYDEDDMITLDLNNQNLFPAFLTELPGHKAGDGVLMAIPAAEGFGARGNEQLGVGPEDTLIFYFDIVDSHAPLTQAEGEAVTPSDSDAENLPEVEADGESAATVTIPEDAEEPSDLVTQVLIKGEGPEVKAGQNLKVHYTGITWSDGEQFDSSYNLGDPATFPIGVGRVIEGWDEGLVGQTVGSRVLLVIPAELAYGEKDEDQAGDDASATATAPPEHELAGETLIFVVDILGAY
ncbi:FKBP-type peptidyl-prolyl cis-trans isomerase [Ornithinimicrobium sp. Y1847]|uniref:FKBP-type peptidyl-prolyl cis-trans isomerase n=1 Tax=unclassified Ornithinimicrobium TaxID=2615080 RepID=UPI003B677602